VARGGSADEFMCSGSLLVLVTPACSSVGFREDLFSAVRWREVARFLASLGQSQGSRSKILVNSS
jgi:hypothetical protein